MVVQLNKQEHLRLNIFIFIYALSILGVDIMIRHNAWLFFTTRGYVLRKKGKSRYYVQIKIGNKIKHIVPKDKIYF